MTVTKDQAQMIATLATAARPSGARRWDSAGVMAALEKVRDRNLGDVILATIRAASDRDVESPGVIPTNGAHWREQLAPQPFVPTSAPTGTRCTVCGQVEGRHTAADHPFSLPREKLAPDVIHTAVAALKDAIEPTEEPAPVRTLDDLADRKPELRARVDVLRAANTGVEAPPMREPQPPEPTTDQADPEPADESEMAQ